LIHIRYIPRCYLHITSNKGGKSVGVPRAALTGLQAGVTTCPASAGSMLKISSVLAGLFYNTFL